MEKSEEEIIGELVKDLGCFPLKKHPLIGILKVYRQTTLDEFDKGE